MKPICVIIFLFTLWSCGEKSISGISYELAKFRKESITNLEYNLSLSIPSSLDTHCTGTCKISFTIDKKIPVILDFLNDSTSLKSVSINGKLTKYSYENEHIYIPKGNTIPGNNTIYIEFTASDQSLNRREEFMYSLLVPDRARTLFPCFDQPDLKARFTLKVEIPKPWCAVSNSKILSESIANERKTVEFAQTEPLSTYLFSIVAGKLKSVSRTVDNRTITMYHRETDSRKLAQSDDIFRQIFYSINWLEDYTAIKYPFEKYDLVILPGFQYGGMEHTGATLYNDRTMFLSPNPTISEQLARASLIAHETAHMWFGDYVTMKWFNDVWMKEVLANYFAAQIVSPQFPTVNHDLNFLFSHAPGAYNEDRTTGANPIQQELDNLNNAGLVYGQIIYKKSPIVMDMLVHKIGKMKFQYGIRRYLNRYSYDNATWDDLIQFFDGMQSWSDTWIKYAGMPTITFDNEVVTQHDPFERGLKWGQAIKCIVIKDSEQLVEIELDSGSMNVASLSGAKYIIPNVDGRGYGFFKMDTASANYALDNFQDFTNELRRGSVLITLNENMINGVIPPNNFAEKMIVWMATEPNNLIFERGLSYIKSCYLNYYDEPSSKLEAALWEMFESGDFRSTGALRTLIAIADTPESIKKLYALWRDEKALLRRKVSLRDAITMSYELALRKPESANKIVTKQLRRITNPDMKEEYLFVSQAVDSSQVKRDKFFNSLLSSDNRSVEPWTARALSYLNHRTRQKEAVKYIRPGLDALTDVHRTGDIFFPSNWCAALLGGHHTAEVRDLVDKFFIDNPQYHKMLASKIKQESDHLYRKTTNK